MIPASSAKRGKTFAISMLERSNNDFAPTLRATSNNMEQCEKVARSAMVTFQLQALSCKAEFWENFMRGRLILILTAVPPVPM